MAYTGLVTNIVGVRKAPNSDNLYLGSCFGEDVLIGKDIQEGELVLYLPSDGRVERWFGDDFHLFRKNEDGTPQGGYLDDNGHVKAIKLRGNFSYGIVVSCEKIFAKYGDLGWKAGDTPTKINDKVFCQKYIPRPSDPSKRHNSNKSGGGLKKGQMGNNGVTYPNFKEHIDTKQLAYNLDQFLPGDIISISLKLHGTSGRTARTDKYYPKGFFRRLFHLPAKHEECFVLGSRRRVIEGEDHYYGDDFRQQHHDRICEAIGNDRLSVYYEIVGYTNNGTPIMPIYDTKKLKDKKLVGKYGSQMVFSYGCEPGTSRLFVYRIVADDEYEFTPGEIDTWCRIHGLEAVPVLENFQFTNVDDLMEHVRECLVDLTDPIGLDHIKEGVVVRIVNRPTFTAFKSKEPAFLVLEGIQKDLSDTPDIEEAEEAVGES